MSEMPEGFTERSGVQLPAGWKRLRGEGPIHCAVVPGDDYLFVLDLLKEMAEALEGLCEEESRRIDYEIAKQTLKKFKEWK